MPPHELFAVGVRLFGVWMLVRAVDYLSAAFALNFIFKAADAENSPRGMMSYAAAYLGLAALFLLGTRRLVRITYGEDRPLWSRRKGHEREDFA